MISGRTAVLVGGNLIFWAALWTLGAPMTIGDDLFFLGPALQLHDGHPLSNPLLRFWSADALHSFFFQPPLFQYVLAGWLNVFGVSAGAIGGLMCTLGAVASTTGGLLLRRLGLQGAWFFPLAIAAMTLPKGIRHDALALALLFAGLLLLTRRTRTSLMAGAALLVAAPLVWPVIVCYAAPLGVAMAGRHRDWWRSSPAELLACAAAGALMAIGLFGVAISFAVVDFLKMLRWHASLRRTPDILGDMVTNITVGYTEFIHGPLYVLAAALFVIALAQRRRVSTLAVLVAAVFAALVLTIGVYANAWHGVAVPFLMLTVGVLALNMIPARRTLVSLGVVALLAWTNILPIVTVLAVRPERPDYYRTVAAQVPRDVCLGIDAVAARYVFDYQLPACAFDFMFALAPPVNVPGRGATPAPGTAWVISQAPGHHTDGAAPEDTARLFGFRFASIPANYLRIKIVR